MSEFRNYRKRGAQPMRPYVVGEDLTGVSVGEGVVVGDGGMVAHDPRNPVDRWYIPADFFQKNYELAE